jgi:hypothetical protein
MGFPWAGAATRQPLNGLHRRSDFLHTLQLLCLALAIGSVSNAAEPRLIESVPANRATDVPIDIGRIVWRFDRPMKANTHSLLEVSGSVFPPMAGSDPHWQDARTFVLELASLEPDTDYGVQLNSERRQGFRSADDGTPLAPTVHTFRTAGHQRGAIDKGEPGTTDPAGPAGGVSPVVGRWQYRDSQIEILVEMTEAGRFVRTVRTPDGVDTVQGRYEYRDGRILAHPDGDEEIVEIPCRFEGAKVLILPGDDGVEFHLNRQPAGTESPATGQAERNAGAPEPGVPGNPGAPLVFQRRTEPNERAFTYLSPKGWISHGGIFHVNPLQVNGPANSILPKNDLILRRDPEGSAYFRWLPVWNYADLRSSPMARMGLDAFPVGSYYQGMPVRLFPSWDGYLQELFRSLHPSAQRPEIIESRPLPELAEVFRRRDQLLSAQLGSIGLSPMEYAAGAIVVDYSENGRRYREALVTALIDNRGAALMWNNDYTLAMRAPVEEADALRPVFNIVRQSVQLDPGWIVRVSQAAGERAQIARQTLEYIQKIDREIVENRARVNSEQRYEGYLLLTGQEDYVNPYTQKVETDTSDFKYRWTTATGEYLYSNEQQFDPNRIREINNVEWQLTPARAR